MAIIPARYESKRFPGKVLADLCGKPVIQHVYEKVTLSKSITGIYIATDDDRIREAVTGFGGNVIMTSPDHESGTDRVAEAAKFVCCGDIIVNVQGDEPLIEPSLIDAVVDKIANDREVVCTTAAIPISDETVYHDPNTVKVVLDRKGRALYFSRSPLPYWRDESDVKRAYAHVGIYCFRRNFLDIFTSLEPTLLEKAEKLEQLRMLEHGYRIGIVLTDSVSKGIDTKEDLEAARKYFVLQHKIEV
ncbi:MAG: 3-deoxy-manno-octulosonate cytidylyltransferase [Candidatus Latescibacteria bacterium]|nr:3-deoxy-manno-octulosonate cytidylyltransferase [Candidatus Latescibacterota bacterium]